MAVVFVLIFHLWPAHLSGGYVGVDVFFVISGYLITKHLVEQAQLGRLSLAAFWARRARRLLPSALLVLATSGLVTFALLPEGLWKQCFEELAASALYVQNWKLALDARDYFAAANQPSAVQHFWSLSVEEQFYFVLPLLLILTQGARARRWNTRRTAATLIALATASSFVSSMAVGVSEPSAYFSTPVRAWEFGAGGLLSFLRLPSPRLRPLLAWSGVGLCLAAAIGFDSQTPFPGAATLVPVLGAAAVVAAGSSGVSYEPAALSRYKPVLFLGDVSYPLYLWHWPLIVWAPLVLGRPIGDMDKLAILFAAVLLGGLTTRWIEAPVRFPARPERQRRPGIVAAWSAAGMALVVGIAAIGLVNAAAGEAASGALVSEIEARHPHCFGASASRPGAQPCVNPDLAGTLVPQPEFARVDLLARPDCRAPAGSLRMCTLGPERGYAKRLAVFGDSHAASLLPAFEVIARTMDWRIDVASKNSCYWSASVPSDPNAAEVEECQRWKAELSRKLTESEAYDAIIVTQRAWRHAPKDANGDRSEDSMVQGLLGAWRTQTLRGTKIIAIRDNPIGDAGRAACVAQHLLLANQFCVLERARGLDTFDAQVPATEALLGSYLIDLSDYYCSPTECPPIIGNVVVYRDTNHITATFARTLAPILLAELREILG